MSDTVISVESVSKLYRLGEVGTGSIAHDVNRWWHLVRGKEDPYLKIGQVNDRTRSASRDESRESSAGEGGRDERRESRVESQPSTLAPRPSTSSKALDARPSTLDKSAPGPDYVYALKDVSFEVKQGEVLGIIGRNGAGKSTLLKILSRVTVQTTGRIRVKGRIASLLEVGTGFHPELTGRENIFLNGAILGMRKHEIKSKFDEIVDFSGVERYIDTPVKRYSSGMYVRLAFAVAAHLEPEILIVDEVLAVGDAEFQKKCLGKMKDVSTKQGRTILFVSHNTTAISSLCGRGVLLNMGQIEKEGPISDVITNYLSQSISRGSQGSHSYWAEIRIAPGTDTVRVRKIIITSEDGGPEDVVDVESPFSIEIEYWILVPQDGLAVNLFFYTIDGTPVFETVSWDAPSWNDQSTPQGLYRSTCKVPGHLFNVGTFRMKLRFFSKSAVLYELEEAAMLTVCELAERKGAWFGKYIGAIHPKLAWESNLLEADFLQTREPTK